MITKQRIGLLGRPPITSVERRTLKVMAILPIAYAVLVCGTTFAGEQEELLDEIRANSALRARFVADSLANVEAGMEREAVMDILLDIATRDNGPNTAQPAVRALFHIAPDDAVARSYLLKILTHPNTHKQVCSIARIFFIYVADEPAQDVLREVVKDAWEQGKLHPGLHALVELGSPRTLAWLEETVQAMDEGAPMRGFLDRHATKIRLQRDLPALLAQLDSNFKFIDKGWVVQQALRYGVARKEIRRRVLDVLKRAEATGERVRETSLIFACLEGGVFTEQDTREVKSIGAGKLLRTSLSGERTSPRWATRAETKRAEFYRLNAPANEPGK